MPRDSGGRSTALGRDERGRGRLGGRRAETDEQVRPDDLQLQVEPRPARPDLGLVGTLVKTPLAARPLAQIGGRTRLAGSLMCVMSIRR